MHSVWVRSNAVLFYGLSILGCLSGLCAMSTVFHESAPDVSVLRMNSLKELRSQPFRHNQIVDRAVLTFDLTAGRSWRRQPHTRQRADRCSSLRVCAQSCGQPTASLSSPADLTSVWNWNVKQLFVFVTAEYKSSRNVSNPTPSPQLCARCCLLCVTRVLCVLGFV